MCSKWEYYPVLRKVSRDHTVLTKEKKKETQIRIKELMSPLTTVNFVLVSGSWMIFAASKFFLSSSSLLSCEEIIPRWYSTNKILKSLLSYILSNEIQLFRIRLMAYLKSHCLYQHKRMVHMAGLKFVISLGIKSSLSCVQIWRMQ